MTVQTDASAAAVAQDCATWPAHEAARWRQAFGPLGLTWQPVTRYTYARVYTRYLESCREAGLPERLSADGLRRFVANRSASMITLAGYVHQLLEVASVVVAEDLAAGRLAWLVETRKRFFAAAARTRKQRNAKVVGALELLAAGARAIDEARTHPRPGSWAATQLYRDGLWLVFGCYVPERRRALAGLTLDDLKAGEVVIDPSLDKTKQGAVRPLPDHLCLLLTEWIEEWRAPVARDDERALFIAKGGGVASDSALYSAMGKLTLRLIGRAVSPHIFRNAAAIAVIEHTPAEAILASVALRHRSQATTARYTEMAKAVEAGRRYSDAVERLAASVGWRADRTDPSI